MRPLASENAKPINLPNCPSFLIVNWGTHPEEAAEQVDEEDEAMWRAWNW